MVWNAGTLLKCFLASSFFLLSTVMILLSSNGAKRQLSLPWSPFFKEMSMRQTLLTDREIFFKVMNSSNAKPASHFDPASDVFVLLHIQKTGGSSFGRLLSTQLTNLTCRKFGAVKSESLGLAGGQLQVRQRKQQDCSVPIGNSSGRAIWLFSRFSVGWSCGLHADFTELTDGNCISKVLDAKENQFGGTKRQRNLRFLTLLREPVSRYLSEWRHISRGATWAGTELRCGGRRATIEEIPLCYDPQRGDWRGVSLKEFLFCESNLANNRQTRMLADLKEVNCYNRSDGVNEFRRAKTMLFSAMRNLATKFAFFGLVEYQRESQLLFEATFSSSFLTNMTQKILTKAERALLGLSNREVANIRQVNWLDVQLYDFARRLFFQRLAHFGIGDWSNRLEVNDSSASSISNSLEV